MKTLQQARINRGYTQKQVADILQVSTSTISRYENHTRNINAYNFTRLCEIYGVSVNVITLGA